MTVCKIGKKCGSSCVQSIKMCEEDLPKKDSTSLDKVVDKILNHKQYLNTPEKAAAWLESHKEQLALAGMGNWGQKAGDLVVLGIEPGGSPDQLYYDSKGNIHPRLAKIKEEDTSSLKNKNWEEWYDSHPLTFANDIRQKFQVLKAVEKFGSSDVAPGYDAALRIRGTDSPLSRVMHKRENWLGNQNPDRSSPFTRKLTAMAEKIGWNSVLGVNLSPFDLPSDKYWPFAKLPLPSNSPLKSRDAWLNFSAKRSAQSIKDQLKESPRKAIFIGANKPAFRAVFDQLAKDYNAVTKTKEISWESSNGRAMKATVNYFVVKGDKGNTVIVQTNHPSWTGWTNQSLREVSEVITNGN